MEAFTLNIFGFLDFNAIGLSAENQFDVLKKYSSSADILDVSAFYLLFCS